MALMTAMAASYAPIGIRVNVVAPGLTATPMAGPGGGRPADRRVRRAQAAPRAAASWTRTTSPHAAVYFLVRRVARGHRPAPHGRRRLVASTSASPRPRTARTAAMTFVRTVLGDIDPAELGVTYAHEHLVIDGGRPSSCPGLPARRRRRAWRPRSTRPPRSASTPSSTRCRPTAGRNPTKLAELSAADRGPRRRADRPPPRAVLRSGALERPRSTRPSWRTCSSPTSRTGIDERDYRGPIVRRTEHRAGVVKIAGSEGGPSARDVPIFRAAAATHIGGPASRSSPIARAGPARSSRSALLDRRRRAGRRRSSLSHVDKVVDRGYHRELLATGAFGEYDQAFRWGDGAERHPAAARVGGRGRPARPGHARHGRRPPGLLPRYGGVAGPDLAARRVQRRRWTTRGLGADDPRTRFFVDNPARAFAFARGRAA